MEKHPGKQYRRRARFKSGAASIMKSERRMLVKQQFEIRYRHWKRGLKSERTIKVTAKTRARAERVFLKSMPGSRVHIISIYPATAPVKGVQACPANGATGDIDLINTVVGM